MIVIKYLAKCLTYNCSVNGGNGYNLSVSMRYNENIHTDSQNYKLWGGMHSGWKGRHYS